MLSKYTEGYDTLRHQVAQLESEKAQHLKQLKELTTNNARLSKSEAKLKEANADQADRVKSMIEEIKAVNDYKAKVRELERQNAKLETRVDEAERKCRGAEAQLADLSPKYDDAVEKLQKKELRIGDLMEDLAGAKDGLRKQEMELIELRNAVERLEGLNENKDRKLFAAGKKLLGFAVEAWTENPRWLLEGAWENWMEKRPELKLEKRWNCGGSSLWGDKTL